MLQDHKGKHTNDLIQCRECHLETHVKLCLVVHFRNKSETSRPEDFFHCGEVKFKERKHKNDFFECSRCDYETYAKRYLIEHIRKKRHKINPDRTDVLSIE